MVKTEITLVVLSEEDIPASATLEGIIRESDSGDYSMEMTKMTSVEVDDAEMAKLLTAQGSDPEFFGLDSDGNRVE